jgi:hypothetical protein
MNRKIAIIVSIIFVAIQVNVASARTDAEIEQAIRGVLMQRHPTDTAEWWRALGERAPAVILKVYENSSHIFDRGKLIQALGYFDDQSVVEFLKEESRRTPDDVLRNVAIRSIGEVRGAVELDFIATFLKHADPHTRLAAAESLRKTRDPRAEALVEKFTTEEKTKWVVSTLKGVIPTPSGPLKVVATSEDRLNREFAGTWRGYYVVPRADSQVGMTSEQAILRIEVDGAASLKGELTLKGKKRVRSFLITRGVGKASRFTVTFAEQISAAERAKPGAKAPELISGDGEITGQAGKLVVLFRAPAPVGTLIVRRDPP